MAPTIKEQVRLVENALALQSLRDSDFDAYSAFGEVIDNSVQAKAKTIALRFKTEPRSKKNYLVMTELAFGDDGEGMNSDIIHRCLQLGYSTRFNDRSSIGRFGVGMTLAAINQCKRVEVYSKVVNGPWLFTYIDLEEIASNPPLMEGIPPPIEKAPPKEYLELVGRESGTLIVWGKYDRQTDSASTMIKEAKIWIGRTYRYFIWEGLSVRVDGELVAAIDPLYARLEKTKFPGDTPAHLYEPMHIEWIVPESDRLPKQPEKSIITINTSLIDKSLRIYRGVGGSPETKERYINRNEGISILRNKREVFYGHIPYWKRAFEDIDRWWGCEIHFDAILDREFTVKNIKRGAIPRPELREVLQGRINPTRNTALEQVSEQFLKEKHREEEALRKSAEAGDKVVTGHEEAQRVAKKTGVDKSQIDKGKNLDEETQKIVNQVNADADARAKSALANLIKDQPFTIIDGDWRGAQFIEISHLGGSDTLHYNMRHPFFVALKKIIDDAAARGGNIDRLKALIDILLISYAKAEARFEKDTKLTAERFVELLQINWGQYLSSYIETWLEEEES